MSSFICYPHPYFTHSSTPFHFSGSCTFMETLEWADTGSKALLFTGVLLAFGCFTYTHVRISSVFWGLQSRASLSFPLYIYSFTFTSTHLCRSQLHLFLGHFADRSFKNASEISCIWWSVIFERLLSTFSMLSQSCLLMPSSVQSEN